MGSRHYRSPSPRRFVNPARASTGTFPEPYHEAYYSNNSSPRNSGERIAGLAPPSHPIAPGHPASRSSHSSYSGRRRSNTLDAHDRSARDSPVIVPVQKMPIRNYLIYDTPKSLPGHPSGEPREATLITRAPRRDHKRIYSVDDNHSTRLIAEVEPLRHEDTKYGTATPSSGQRYHHHKPLVRTTDFDDEGYSYTDPASMYRDTEPAWRSRPRSGSIERGSRPSSMLMDKGPRTSNRELGPPPSTRGFDKINSGLMRNSSLRERPRSGSRDRYGDSASYRDEYYTPHSRSSSSTHHPTMVHQEPRRDVYSDDHDRRAREKESRRHRTDDRFEDREVTSRGFGIRTDDSKLRGDESLDRRPIWSPHETGRGSVDDYGSPFYPPDEPRREARMPDPRIPHERDAALYDDRSRDRDYDRARDRDYDRSRDRDYERRDREREDRGYVPRAVPVAAAGTVAGYGASEGIKSHDRHHDHDRNLDYDRDRDHEPERDRVREPDRDRARDRERDSERERERERDHDRGDRIKDHAYDRHPERIPDDRASPPTTSAYPSKGADRSKEVDRKDRDVRYEDEEPRRRRHHHGHSSDDSDHERSRRYVDRDPARESDSRKDSPRKPEATLDPDEEYRRRVQQEIERNSRAAREHDLDDPDKERELRRRHDERDRYPEERDKRRDSPGGERRPPPSSMVAEPSHSKSASVLNKGLVHEPDSLPPPTDEVPSKSLQIVTPPKDPPAPPKGILRKPTEKFPEHPEPIREGVAPHKSALKGKDIPPNARWTKIDRRLVNPEALEEAKERFEERLDCVIVLRVLTKAEIQKLADRTKEIRNTREDEYERRERRERRSHRRERGGEERDSDAGSNSDDDNYEKGKDQHVPRMIEDGRE
ncbi:hypothetical protein GQ43DRAFT_449284 [Delitschia confertaspora ATCC 74209]|uniref:DUF8035 domain-containing protein n=1 Tax=Delitschia confertaspora ATCC 74209 TaxID=1513339 RepID=A0A9P4JP95_9PLEO|nr:hypothetical protein GQ43DRAFT_449284 [Delitschia confertaspora ATCC 74209]